MKLLSIFLLLTAAVSPCVHAQRVDMQVGGPLLQMTVYDRDSQQLLPIYRHDGRYYVAGVPGHRYELKLWNRSAGDVLGIVSVDGVNAVSGRTANWSQDDGYVLDSGTNYGVKGWRKSESQVAGFVFADAGDSYASRTGRPDNVGVIGIAVFRSRDTVQAIARDEISSAEPEAAAPMQNQVAAAPALAERASKDTRMDKTDAPLGTGFGQRERDQVHDVDFEKASSEPDQIITLYYDTRAHLIARGVLPMRSLPTREPEAFPGRFVPDPPVADSMIEDSR